MAPGDYTEGIMPRQFGKTLSDSELNSLVDHLASLGVAHLKSGDTARPRLTRTRPAEAVADPFMPSPLKAATDEIARRWDELLNDVVQEEIAPRRTDVEVELLALAWLHLLLPTIRETMIRRAFANLGEKVTLVPPSFNHQNAGVIGAAALALNRFFYQQYEGAG